MHPQQVTKLWGSAIISYPFDINSIILIAGIHPHNSNFIIHRSRLVTVWLHVDLFVVFSI